MSWGREQIELVGVMIQTMLYGEEALSARRRMHLRRKSKPNLWPSRAGCNLPSLMRGGRRYPCGKSGWAGDDVRREWYDFRLTGETWAS
jgi:hypothetical protein